MAERDHMNLCACPTAREANLASLRSKRGKGGQSTSTSLPLFLLPREAEIGLSHSNTGFRLAESERGHVRERLCAREAVCEKQFLTFDSNGTSGFEESDVLKTIRKLAAKWIFILL